MKSNSTKRAVISFLFLVMPLVGYAEYHGFNTAYNSDGIVQDVRWPYWAESTYNALYSQTLMGSDGGQCFFYGGMPSDPNSTPPCSIIWSFWPPSGTVVPGAAVTAEWTGPNMFAPPHIGEGASGKASGVWPIITTNRWYREVLRVWQPTDGTPNLGYTARWLRDSDTGIWYHLATMKVPFAATGINPLSGFQEDFSHGNRNPRRTDYRNVYYRQGGAWQMANQFTASVRQDTEKGTAQLIEGDTAAFFEVSMDPAYSGNLDNDAGQKSITLTIVNQPPTPSIDPIVVSSSGASVSGDQLLVHWQLPATSSPQFAYQIEVFDNPGYAGSPVLTAYDIAPETRQTLLDITGVATPYVQLTITDIFDVDNTPIRITPVTASLNTASSVPSAVNGLDYQYFEKGSDFVVLPDFSTLTPVSEGAVNYPDLTIRDQRDHYAFKYTGYMDVPADGIYTFTLHSSDGSKLLIDGATVVDWDGQHSPGPLSGWVALQAGKHAVDLRYFFDNQNNSAGDLIDSLTVSWTGPGFSAPVEVPVSVWYRVPASGEPIVTLSSPSDSTSISGAEVLFSADVTPNGASVEKVQFFVGKTYWGEDDTAPYELDTFAWEAVDNPIHARVFYNAGQTVDSAQNRVTTANMSLAPWENLAMSEHTYPQGARTVSETHSLIGDGLNFLGRQVSGDCTIIARVADISSAAAGPDGEAPDRSWEAGIIMRETAVATPGMPLGNNSSDQFAAVFATVNNDTRFQDGTMSNAGGPYWSSGLGGQHWLKLERVGNTFTTFVSTDGAAWTAANTNTLSGVNSMLYVGMFTYAASSQNPNVHHASFDSVSLIGNVVGPPAVTVAPQTTTAYTGQSTPFTALPSGNAPFSYQWQYNGTDLAGETAATLTLANLQPTRSGLYTVMMTNADGSASSTAELTVLTPLPIVDEIMDNNPLGYWRLNDTGPTAEDAVGNLNATGQGGVVFGAAGAGSPFNGFESSNVAAQFNGTDSAIAIPPLGITTTNFTITGWAKRDGSQYDYSGLLFSRPGGGVGIMITGNALRFSWDDDGSEYGWNSGLTLPDGQWTFFALTIEPTRAILYKATSGSLSSATRIGTNNPRTLDASFFMGYDPNSSSRRFNGEIDEVAFYNRTLSSTELQGILDASLLAAPDVALASPVDDAVFEAPADISINANITANGHTISKVQFFNGSTLLGEDTTAPYSWTWNGVATGRYTLFAQAVYDGGSVMSSAPVNMSVQTAPGAASMPVPANSASDVNPRVFLGWTAGSMATSHNVYFGTNSIPAFQGNQTDTTYDAGPLQGNTTYYWAVDEVNSIGTTAGLIWSFTTAGNTISINFEQSSNQGFSGGEMIGPLSSDSTYWNATSGASGLRTDLADNSGMATGVDIEWQCSTTYFNTDGTGDDEHRLSIGYLDDGNSGSGDGVTVAIRNIPYTAYKVYGLFASDGSNGGSAMQSLDFNVNGSWVYGGTTPSTATVYGNIDLNHTNHGEYWTEIAPGAVTGNYWTMVTTGTTCSITGRIRSGSLRGSLTGVIIEQLQDTDGDGFPDASDPDDDNDGIPDTWEIARGLDPFVDDRSDHSDSDAFDNWHEYVTNTDPLDGNAFQTFSFEIDQSTDNPSMRFGTSASRFYAVEFRNDLSTGSWSVLGTEFPGTGSEMTVPDPANAFQRYYRLRVELP